METLTLVVGILALLGCGLVGGIFFAFSSFVMRALTRLPFAEGIGAMQSINVVVLNPSFLGAFFGTALLSLGAAGLALSDWGLSYGPYFLAGALSYLLGTFFVTALGNVPLNNELAAISASDQTAHQVWERYVKRWTRWNHVRTIASMAAMLFLCLGLLQL